MDGERFDAITRTWATASRRRLLRSLVGGIAAGALGALNREAIRAAPNICATLCADQHGARGAQCRQACKECGGDESRLCPTDAGFSCCPGATPECANGVCCPAGSVGCQAQVAGAADFCCPGISGQPGVCCPGAGVTPANPVANCCPAGTNCCVDRPATGGIGVRCLPGSCP
jgi:hypothetical protein